MNGDVENQALVRPPGEPRNQNQMSAGADGEKFSHALNERQNHNMQEGHGGTKPYDMMSWRDFNAPIFQRKELIVHSFFKSSPQWENVHLTTAAKRAYS